eukprot:2097569-Amphidinium_carterae.1
MPSLAAKGRLRVCDISSAQGPGPNLMVVPNAKAHVLYMQLNNHMNANPQKDRQYQNAVGNS